jgi:hypothetical protein
MKLPAQRLSFLVRTMGNIREAAKMNMKNGRMLISRETRTNAAVHNGPHMTQPGIKQKPSYSG